MAIQPNGISITISMKHEVMSENGVLNPLKALIGAVVIFFFIIKKF